VSGNVDGLAQLRAALRSEPPAGLSEVDDDVLITLAAAIREAEEHQRAELLASGDRALRVVPRLLRGPVRKAIFG
jgi:hypothetical protein